MKGFVVGHSRSGTLWLATALRYATDLDARHEAMGYEIGESYGDNAVEVNSRFWDRIPEIRRKFPRAKVLHLVRDPRLVVPSVLRRRPEETVEVASRRWVRWNREVERRLVGAAFRYRLEDLVSDFWGYFYPAAAELGSRSISEPAWKGIAEQRLNSRTPDGGRTYPDFELWPEDDRSLLLDICGSLMERYDYR